MKRQKSTIILYIILDHLETDIENLKVADETRFPKERLDSFNSKSNKCNIQKVISTGVC